MKTKRATVKVISICPHCGCSIYSRAVDGSGLPIPEYICQCRFLAAVASGPDVPYYPSYPVPTPYHPLPWWLTQPTCGPAYTTGDFWPMKITSGGAVVDAVGH